MPSPYQLISTIVRLASGAGERERQSFGVAAGVEDDIGLRRRRAITAGRARNARRALGDLRARGFDVDDVTSAPGSRAASEAIEKAEHAGADDDDAVARARARIPDRVQRGLHIGGERRAARGVDTAATAAACRAARRSGPDADAGRRPSCRATPPGRPRPRPRRNSRISPGRENRPPASARACAHIPTAARVPRRRGVRCRG